ncbi:MAG: 30S ribosomal protein S8e [Nanoarchaeota archaeon]|nr:30S ribosomal protein S8e [Nanoarchaeota archaeon]
MKLGKKVTGGRYIKGRKKKKYEMTGQKKTVKLGEVKRKSIRTTGGNKKTFLLRGNVVNVQVGDKGKRQKLAIKNVLETPSNRFLARQNIITKGTIVETEAGKVKVTNRPTQEGNINGVLLK